jgi:3-oxoacyl-[acyl-carrier-protein] synthase-3
MALPELHIIGMGYSHPDTIIDNQFLEDLNVGTTAAWILEKIGIQTRRSTLPIDYIRDNRNADPREAVKVASMSELDLGVRAAEMALARASIGPDKIGMVICNSCAPSFLSPTESHGIAKRLGIRGAAFDVFSACPAFALHVDFLRSYADSVLPEYVLCVSTGALTQKVNYNDRTDGAIWGDGAAAWVVSPKHEGKLRICNSTFTADAPRCGAVVIETFKYFHQDGRAVRDFSVRQTVRLIRSLEEQFNLDWSHDIFVGHQANRTMLEQITNNRQIPESNHWHNAEWFGNQAGASAPIVIAQHWDEIQPGRRILSAVVGAGLSWGSVLLETK